MGAVAVHNLPLKSYALPWSVKVQFGAATVTAQACASSASSSVGRAMVNRLSGSFT